MVGGIDSLIISTIVVNSVQLSSTFTVISVLGVLLNVFVAQFTG